MTETVADILKAVVGKTEHHVKNSMDMAESLSDFVIEEEDILNSHDVVSLFTNTPVEKALHVIEKRLRSDNSWKDATCLEVEDVIELLEFTLTTTYFRSRGQIYRQKFGTAMGSPVSPLVADLYMEYLD